MDLNDELQTFCENCRADLYYNVKELVTKGTLKGQDYEYVGKIAVCEKCGFEVYVAKIEDYNLNALYKSYRNISLQKIWEETTKILSYELTDSTFDTWIRPIEPIAIEDNTIISAVPTVFYKDILVKKYSKLIKSAINLAASKDYDVEFIELNNGNLNSFKYYCCECDKNVEVTFKVEKIDNKIDGIDVFYVGKKAYCNECSKEVYIAELNNENVGKAHAKYKKTKESLEAHNVNDLLDVVKTAKKTDRAEVDVLKIELQKLRILQLSMIEKIDSIEKRLNDM